MTCNVLMRTLNPTHSLTHSLTPYRSNWHCVLLFTLQTVWVVSWNWCGDEWPRSSHDSTDDSPETGFDVAYLAWETEAFRRNSRYSLCHLV